jgi:hypothetical protein
MSTHTPTHAYTQTHSPIHTSLVSVHTHQHAPTCHEPDVCAYRSIPIHAYTHSLPLSHTHPQTTIPYTALRRTSSATFAASGCASSSAATTSSPAPFLAAKCRGSLPSCARADSRQSQHTTHAASQQGGQKALCSCLLPLCESVMRPSCSLRVQYMFVCVCLGRERGCVCERVRESERQRKRLCVCVCVCVSRVCG